MFGKRAVVWKTFLLIIQSFLDLSNQYFLQAVTALDMLISSAP